MMNKMQIVLDILVMGLIAAFCVVAGTIAVRVLLQIAGVI